MRVLLIYLSDSNDRREFVTTIAPIALFSTAAFLEQEGHEVTVANFSHVGYKKAIHTITELVPDAVIVSLLTHNRLDSLRLIREIRKALPSTVIIAGGPHASNMAGDIVSRCMEIDYIIKGDAETALSAILQKGKQLPRGVVEGSPCDLSSLPSPASFSGRCRGVNTNEQFKFIHTGRGLPASLCSAPAGEIRLRAASAILDEIETASRRYGIIYFSFRDDLFLSDRALVLDVCRGIIERKLFIMWSAQGLPSMIDFDMLTAMKKAGCERIFLTIESGSAKMLAQYNPSIMLDDIEKASSTIRTCGLYLSWYIHAGMRGESHADIVKTIRLIRKSLPGDGIVAPAVYYPGSPVCAQAFTEGTLSPAAFFSAKGKGLYIRSDEQSREWTTEIKNALSMVREKSWYTPKDFHEHKRAVGESWVGEILEGDLYLDKDDFRRAEERYAHVTSMSSGNPWGYLRMGKLRFRAGDFASAEGYFSKVTGIVPLYYGGWLKLAEAQTAQGKKKEAKGALEQAWNLNKWDLRVANLKKVL